MGKEHMIILYVKDQAVSRDFYEKVLSKAPILDVPGMTEFSIATGIRLGLMPEKGIEKIICPVMPAPASGSGVPRCELYLIVDEPQVAYENSIKAGAKGISEAGSRDWGDTVAYCSDPDGHILAFAK